jgi:DNA (cytosine-5)-methyltransferase 1
MVTYNCERCGKNFAQKSHFDSHKKRKTPCENNANKIKEMVDKAVEEKLKHITSVHVDSDSTVIANEDNNSKKVGHTNMKFIDLCCGIGGFHQALGNMGMTCVMASDIDKDCRENYELNYKLKPEGDLTKIVVEEIPAFDVLCAGFPCQPFSKAGQQNGFDDDRGNIFFDICNITKHHKPKYLILENVRNLASHDNGNTWNVIKHKLDELNYYTYDEPVILNTLYFGVPQSRERVVIMCKRKDLGELDKLPSITKQNTMKTSLETIIEDSCDSKYNITGKMKVTQEVWNEFLTILNEHNISIPKYPIWTDWWDSNGENTTVTKYNKKISEEENKTAILKAQTEFYEKYTNWIDKNRDFYKDHKQILEPWVVKSRQNKLWQGAVRKMEWQTGIDNLNMSQVLWSPRGSGVRIKNIDYSPTLVAMASMIPIYGPKKRQLTPRECARLQSFPDDYIIHNDDKISYKQFGNAVNVKMIEKTARFLIYNENLF